MMMRFCTLLLLSALLALDCRQTGAKNLLEVTYIANEGFMIAMGKTKVLIDALSRSKYYAEPSDTLVAKMTNDIPPFDNVDYFLVTHDHADHFNADLVSRYIRSHPQIQLVGTPETWKKLSGDSARGGGESGFSLALGEHRTVHGNKAEIVVIRLYHGSNPDATNFAYLVRANGFTVLHMGDAQIVYNEAFLRMIDWSSYNVDVAFLEFFDNSSETRNILESMIKPKHVVLMHIPPGEEDTVKNTYAKDLPRTMVFMRESETMRFDSIVASESVP
jgi:L-ascorbate metabolism protein UlaG (beta-lactamase superfamily)